MGDKSRSLKYYFSSAAIVRVRLVGARQANITSSSRRQRIPTYHSWSEQLYEHKAMIKFAKDLPTGGAHATISSIPHQALLPH